jgi:hypothetical protein
VKIHRFRVVLGVLITAWGAATGEVAQAQTTTNYPVSATCSVGGAGGGQLCPTIPTITITTNGLLQAQFTASSLGCSSFKIHWLVDGTEVAATGFVAPGGISGLANLGPVGAGSHVVGLLAEGQLGGCNVGILTSWSGTAAITTDASVVPPVSAPVATPTLSDWSLVAMAVLLAVLAVAGLRTRRTKPD